MRKCFKFAKENSSSLGIVYRPVAKVGLRDASGELFELSMLVDSGADISILSKRIGDIMGLDVEQGEAKVFQERRRVLFQRLESSAAEAQRENLQSTSHQLLFHRFMTVN